MDQAKIVQNFGRNLSFKPLHFYSPINRDELIDILEEHKSGKIRVVASKHSWSALIETKDVLIDMSHFDYVKIQKNNLQTSVIVGAGCKVERLLKELNLKGLTIPSVGLIDQQTIAGAISTGTHGSGKHSLSHYIESVQLACFDESGNSTQIVNIREGEDLQAARCSLGCLGVVVELTLPCIPQYFIQEKSTFCETIEQVLVLEKKAPLQQFFLMPHSWKFFAQERLVAPNLGRRGFASIYRIYWFLVIDLGMHLVMKALVSILKSRRLVRTFFRSIVPSLVFSNWVVTDRSDRALVMKHELFRHLELEAFVVRSHVIEAASFVKDILQYADDDNHQLSDSTYEKIKKAQLTESLSSIKGSFTHHYPICFRRVLSDDTLISMASGESEDWYAISFITYLEPRDEFLALVTFLSNSMFELFDARIHWGKWFPQTSKQVNKLYPKIDTFRNVCSKYDPNGVFRNTFVEDKLDL